VNGDPTVTEGTAFLGDRHGYLRAFDAETGDQHWSFKTGNAVQSKPLVTDDTVYFGSNDTHVYAIER
jgi:outer membrane protein assembly factor BamB